MKTKTKCAVLLLCLWSLSVLGFANAQNQVKSSVLGNGGGVTSNGSFRTLSTLGQTLMGTTANASNTIHPGFWFQTIDIFTSIEQIPSETIPEEFRLEQNYPNPFNPTTTIEFALPKQSVVSLTLYDILGREIEVLIDDELKSGVYKVTFQADALPSGIYFYRIQADGFIKAKILTLLK
jgi:hypothetical protein